MSDLETLLRASVELARLRRQVTDITEENRKLKEQVNRREFDLSADTEISCLLRPQAG